jgi:hypothetical protein
MELILVRHGGLVWRTVALSFMVVASCSAWLSWHRCEQCEANHGRRGEPTATAVRAVLGMLVIIFALWIALAIGLKHAGELPYSIVVAIAIPQGSR